MLLESIMNITLSVPKVVIGDFEKDFDKWVHIFQL